MKGVTKKVLLRLPDDLADEIDARAAKVGRSRNEWLVHALRWAVSQPIRETTVTKKEQL